MALATPGLATETSPQKLNWAQFHTLWPHEASSVVKHRLGMHKAHIESPASQLKGFQMGRVIKGDSLSLSLESLCQTGLDGTESGSMAQVRSTSLGT